MAEISQPYNRLNSFYLRLWGYLDQYFEEDYGRSLAAPLRPELGVLARLIRRLHELASLKNVESYVLPSDIAEVTLQQLEKNYEQVVSAIDDDIAARLEELEGVSQADFDQARKYAEQVGRTITEYVKMEPHWLARAQSLRTELGDKALEMSGKILLD